MSKKRRRKIPQTLKQRILVCGSRNWTNKKVIERELEQYFKYEDAIPVVIHGCARGADTFAGKIAKKAGVEVKEFPANWGRGSDGWIQKESENVGRRKTNTHPCLYKELEPEQRNERHGGKSKSSGNSR